MALAPATKNFKLLLTPLPGEARDGQDGRRGESKKTDWRLVTNELYCFFANLSVKKTNATPTMPTVI